ncbi:MAG TPA: hypothetical protein VM487_09865, partial [Phycisphaerae bacterium]|nr:hypothetical protein [Phycisphaerae bacterium]
FRILRGKKPQEGEFEGEPAEPVPPQGLPRNRHYIRNAECLTCTETLHHGYHNEHLRWFDSDFDIHPNHTRGKGSLAVELVVKTGDERGVFTDFNYRVYCFESGCGAGAAYR